MLGRQQTVQSSVNVCRRPPLGSTNTSLSSPQNAQLYDTSLSLPDVVRRFDCRSPLLSRDDRHCAGEHRDERRHRLPSTRNLADTRSRGSRGGHARIARGRGSRASVSRHHDIQSMRCDTAARCRVTRWPYRGSTGSAIWEFSSRRSSATRSPQSGAGRRTPFSPRGSGRASTSTAPQRTPRGGAEKARRRTRDPGDIWEGTRRRERLGTVELWS